MTWHCDVTRNPVGTDTVMIGASPCDCQGCRAAARIEALEKLYAESRQELMKWIRNDPADAEIERRLHARIEALEAALREIAGRSWHPANVRLGDIARAALEPEQDK